jgi:diacylglycerol kinase (ATP)
MTKNAGLRQRATYSLKGLREGWRRERSFRTHAATSAALLLVMAALQPPALWWALVLMSLAVGMALELVNGAIEALLDHLHPQHHPQVGAAKDMASAAAFIANCTAAAVAAATILGHH